MNDRYSKLTNYYNHNKTGGYNNQDEFNRSNQIKIKRFKFFGTIILILCLYMVIKNIIVDSSKHNAPSPAKSVIAVDYNVEPPSEFLYRVNIVDLIKPYVSQRFKAASHIVFSDSPNVSFDKINSVFSISIICNVSDSLELSVNHMVMLDLKYRGNDYGNYNNYTINNYCDILTGN